MLKYKKAKTVTAAGVLTAQAVIATFVSSSLITYSVSAICFAGLVILFSKDILGLIKFAMGFAKKLLKRGA